MNKRPAANSNNTLSTNKLYTILESISDGVMAVDLDGRVVYFNRAAERITGIARAEALEKPCRDVMNVVNHTCAIEETLRTGEQVINRYVCLLSAAGERTPISVSTALLRNRHREVTGAVETFRDLTQVEELRKSIEGLHSFSNMIGRSKPMSELFETLPLIAASDSNVLIRGENGTGKELVARAIHAHSTRCDKPMVSVNVAAIPETLLESELFGHTAGAFTGARSAHMGRFERADGGTLFLDEIGDLSVTLQVKLLRALQEGEIEPVGAEGPRKVDVRVVAATNSDLPRMIEENTFRRDLYYRLNVVELCVPRLRDRPEDIPLLIDHFIGRFNQLKSKDISGIHPNAMHTLLNHEYPGNVRELENIIEHAFVLCPGGIIRPEHLPRSLRGVTPTPVVQVSGTLEQMEILTITAALKRNSFKRKETAAELGIDPSTLYRKIRKHKIIIPESTETSTG